EQSEQTFLQFQIGLDRKGRTGGSAVRRPCPQVPLMDRGDQPTFPHHTRDGPEIVAKERLDEEGTLSRIGRLEVAPGPEQSPGLEGIGDRWFQDRWVFEVRGREQLSA